MRILVTGGSGFLGRNVIARMIGDGHAVSCLDRYEAPFLRDLGVRFVQGDIYEKVAVAEAMAGCDAVLHMACTSIPKTSNDDPHFDVMSNVGGSLILLDAAVANGVKRFVFISSGGTVYGRPVSLPISECHPTCPECSYGITKLAIEKYLRLYKDLKGLQTCTLRLANPFGEFQRYKTVQGVIPVICYRAMKGDAVDIWGDGSVVRDFVYVGDVVDAVMRAIERADVSGEINIGAGVGTSVNEIVAAVEMVSGRKISRRYLPGRPFDVPANVLDISLAAERLGWRPMTSMEDGLRRTIRWIAVQEGMQI